MLQNTLLRLLPSVAYEDLVVVSHHDYAELVAEQLKEIAASATSVLFEPSPKNTAPAIAFALQEMSATSGPETLVLVAPSDHYLEPAEHFKVYLELAKELAGGGAIVTFGVEPLHPATGYGYIQKGVSQGAGFTVPHFCEKPTLDVAKRYLESGDYLWNTGMFVATLGTLIEEMAKHAPEVWGRPFADMATISIDYALLEHSDRLLVVPMALHWSDVGSCDSLYALLDKDQNDNVKIGSVVAIDTTDSLIIGKKRLISTIGVSDLLVIETEDALLIAKRGQSQKVRELVQLLREQGRLC
jgi:mannose-1-phosphate guanylyltransferase/mannose-6-phosphate isomerase